MAWGCVFPLCIKVPLCAPGCLKVPVKLHWSLLLFIGACVATDFMHFNIGQLISTIFYAAIFVTLTAIIVGMVQSSVATCFGAVPKAIVIWPIGGVALYDTAPAKHCHRFTIAFAGILTYFAMAMMYFGFVYALGCGIGGDVGAHIENNSTISVSYCEILPWSEEIDYAEIVGFQFSFWLAAISFQMFMYNLKLLVLNLFIPVIPLACATIVVSSLLLCGVSKPRVAVIAMTLSCFGLLALGTWAVIVVICSTVSGHTHFDVIALMSLLYLAMCTRTLHKAWKNEKLDTHPLFALAPSAADAGAPTDSPAVNNAQLSQSLVVAGAGGSSEPEPKPKKRGTGGFNPFKRASNAGGESSNDGQVTINVTPDQVVQGAQWAANNPGTVASVANIAGRVAQASDANPFLNNAHLSQR